MNNNDGGLIYRLDENQCAYNAQEEVKCFILNEKDVFLQNVNTPFRVNTIGITYPNANYYFERRVLNGYLLEYIIEGKGYIIKNATKQTVEQGDVFIFYPDCKYKCYSDKQTPFKKIWINFSSEVFTSILKAYGLYGITIFKNADVNRLFEQLVSLCNEYTCSIDVSPKAGTILLEILSSIYVSRTENTRLPHAIAHLKSRLDKAVYGKITIEEVADELNISKAQLIKGFKKYFQLTPYNYLLSAKIQTAKQLLSLTDMSVRNISNSLNFADEHYFSNVFKKKTSFTPLEYRKKYCT